MKSSKSLSALLIACWLISYYAHSTPAQQINLPSLGDSTSSHVSPQQEFEVGRVYLKIIRRQTPTVDDPELKDYLERLVFRLSEASEITDHRLITLLVNNSQFNAFAAPGGIIGVNTGLFFYAQTEAQFAGVLAHEFAHLSQRHYARNVKKASENFLPVAAALLGSLILMAANATDVGFAAFTSTVAGLQSSRLSFSRLYEREADNIGILTLARAGFDPHAMPEVFEQMNKANTHGSAPEFLLTHPITENRIADSRARASQFKKTNYKDSSTYQLMRMRIKFLAHNDTKELLKELLQNHPNEATTVPDASRYLMAIAATKTQDYNLATKQLTILLQKEPSNIHYIIAKAKLNAASGDTNTALKQISGILSTHPDAYPLLALKSDILIQQKNYKAARDILLKLSHMRFEDPDIWYELAEAQGMSEDNLGLHQARAEYFFLTGDLENAMEQIKYAQKLTGNNYVLKAKLDQKLEDMHNYQKKISQ